METFEDWLGALHLHFETALDLTDVDEHITVAPIVSSFKILGGV